MSKFDSLRRNPWTMVVVLMLVNAVNHVDRSVMIIVAEPLRQEMNLSDSALGALSGMLHSVALAIFVIPMGILADRARRARMLAIVVAAWSAFTGLTAFATNYLQIALARICVGAGEAGAVPLCVSMISDRVPEKKRPTAMGVFYFGTALGSGLLFLLGGLAADRLGWRAVFLFAAAPGLVLAAIVWFLPDGRPGFTRTSTAVPHTDFWRAAREMPLQAWLVIAAAVGATAVESALWIWMGSFLVRVHELTLTQVGAVIGVSMVGGKGAGALLSGPLTRLVSRDHPHGLWRYPAIVMILYIPLGWAMVSVDSAAAATFFIFALALVGGGWPAQTMNMLIQTSPVRKRGFASGLYQFCINCLGVSMGPLAVGVLSDSLGPHGIAVALGFIMLLNAPSALCLALASRRARASADTREL